MDTNKLFTVYALILLAGIASVLTASVLSGITTLPSPLVFLEHVALGLSIRASYKSFGGWSWADWTFTADAAERPARGVLGAADGTAGAEA